MPSYRALSSGVSPEANGDTPLSWVEAANRREIKYKLRQVPKELVTPSGWSKPLGIHPDLPFAVTRTPKGQNLPVYRDIRNGQSRVVTIIRRTRGDLDVMQQEIEILFEGQVDVKRRTGGVLELNGDHRADIVRWLKGLGL
jgi:large subunit ribosomal protein L49